MAYSTSLPPQMALAGAIAGAPNFWVYRTADTAATVDTSGYFTNGYDLGMRDGDLLFLYVTGTKVWTTHTITVSGTTVNVADGTTVGSGTNTD